MLTMVIVLKALVEIAALALLGQGLLYILAGAKRDTNVFYRLLSTLTRPVMQSVRFIAPRFIVDQHIGSLAFLIMAVVWYLLLVGNHALCMDDLRNPGCGKLAADYVKRCEAGNAAACETLERNGIHARR